MTRLRCLLMDDQSDHPIDAFALRSSMQRARNEGSHFAEGIALIQIKHTQTRDLRSAPRAGVIDCAMDVKARNWITQSDVDSGRIHITFSNTGRGGGSGYLFYQGERYGLAVITPAIGKIWATSIDLIGTASNLRGASDVLGTYSASDGGATTVKRARTVRLQNKKGVVLEIR